VADVHIHTNHSDGEDSPAGVVDHAVRRGLQLIAITDHDRIAGALAAAEHARRHHEIEVIVGEEVSTRDGHVIALFLTRCISPGMSAVATVAAIHRQGGLAVAAHPYWRAGRSANGKFPHGVGDIIARADFDAVEVMNGGFTPSMVYANVLAGWANRHVKLAEVGGSDAHVKQAVGCVVTEFEGSSAADFRNAVVTGNTRARLRRPSAVAIGRYVAWGLTPRSTPMAETA
jgi:hypothetical protein